jgi:hypothetical protein
MKKKNEALNNIKNLSNKYPTYKKTPIEKTINLFKQNKEIENKAVRSERSPKFITEKSPTNRITKLNNKVILFTPNKPKAETPIFEKQSKTKSTVLSSKNLMKIRVNKFDKLGNKNDKNDIKKIYTKENIILNDQDEKGAHKVIRKYSEIEFIKNKYKNLIEKFVNDF